MSIPRFSAEAPVYRTRGHYRVSGARGDASGSLVGPQADADQAAAAQQTGPWAPGGNWWHCWYIDRCIICCSPYWCWYYCRWGATQV